MGKKLNPQYIGLLIVLAGLFIFNFVRSHGVAVLQPRGEVASKEFRLIVISTLLMLIVVIPVFIMTFWIAWKYREGNTKSKYTPEWDHHPVLESIWWGLPCLIILVLAGVAWRSSHELDPSRPLVSNVLPLKVQVVAMDWKWLFIYPEQGIASVNYLRIPVDRPVDFQITSDAPMNSFWIPSLGGQIYAMAGMNTQLHLMANKPGTYQGSSANLSGKGFYSMKFDVAVVDSSNFDKWAAGASSSKAKLDMSEYTKLVRPSENIAPQLYAVADNSIYSKVIMKYMSPQTKLQALYIESRQNATSN